MSEKSLLEQLPPAVRPWADKAVTWARGLSRPARIFALTTLLALAAGGGFLGLRGANPTYVTLFSNLERDDAGQVVAKLKEMKVPYRVEGDGTVVEVPEERARELRLELASAGLPRGGAVGFESFDKMRLGATEFEQRILYRRALEGELGRTIGTVGAVQNARVHLVLPEKSVFVSKNEPSSASVVLKLRGGRALGPGEVQGIVHLVSTSVAGLSPDRVAIVTTEGTVLHKPRGQDPLAEEERSSARTLESALEERARAIVEKVTGPGHADVRITAEMDLARVERVEDHYDPKNTALRSEERNLEKTGVDESVAGVPGAESNLPRAGADGGVTTTAQPGVTRDQHTRNFEVDHVTEKRIVAGGVLRRLTVAVVIDGTRSKEDLEKIESLVKNAVGFNGPRGDAVSVEAVPFLAGEPTPAAPEPSKIETTARKVGPVVLVAAALVATLVMVLRMRRRQKKVETTLALAAAKDREDAMKVEIIEPELEKAPSEEDLKALVRERALRDPATAALVVRGWLGSAPTAESNPKDAAA